MLLGGIGGVQLEAELEVEVVAIGAACLKVLAGKAVQKDGMGNVLSPRDNAAELFLEKGLLNSLSYGGRNLAGGV